MRMSEPQLQRACACGGRCPRCQTGQPGQEHKHLQTKRTERRWLHTRQRYFLRAQQMGSPCGKRSSSDRARTGAYCAAAIARRPDNSTLRSLHARTIVARGVPPSRTWRGKCVAPRTIDCRIHYFAGDRISDHQLRHRREQALKQVQNLNRNAPPPSAPHCPRRQRRTSLGPAAHRWRAASPTTALGTTGHGAERS